MAVDRKPPLSTGNIWIAAAAISGLLAVALGAFGAHALKDVLDNYGHSIWDKAVLYQMFHTLALLIVGLLNKRDPALKFGAAGLFFSAGILLFSGSLYLLALVGQKFLGWITPFGGVAFLLGWAILGWRALRTSDSSRTAE